MTIPQLDAIIAELGEYNYSLVFGNGIFISTKNYVIDFFVDFIRCRRKGTSYFEYYAPTTVVGIKQLDGRSTTDIQWFIGLPFRANGALLNETDGFFDLEREGVFLHEGGI